MLVAIISLSLFSVTAFAQTSPVNEGDVLIFNGATADNAFGDLLNWNGIVFGDANNINSVEGSFAVNGSVNSSTGLSVNGGIDGLNPASTEDVALLIHDNAIIGGYGNVWGQTVIGNNEGNTYNLSNVTPSRPDGWPRGYTVADSTQYFENAKNTAYDVKNSVEKLTINGSYEVLEDGKTVYKFKGNKDADTLVYNVNESTFDSYRFDFEIADNQTVVLNFTATEKIQMSNGAWSINGIDKLQDLPYLKGYNRNIIVNIVNAQELEMSNCDMYGILLAPNTTLKGQNGYVCGTSIVKNIDCPQGWNGFGLLLGGNSSYIPSITDSVPEQNVSSDKGNIRIDVPLKMAVAFEDGSVYYGGEMKEIEFNKEYHFQMCTVNWSNGLLDDNNGLRGSVVYTMEVIHNSEFKELAASAKEDPERYTVKGIDVIDNVNKKIFVNGDATEAHLETDVNNFFMAYRFYFKGENYNHQTGIDKVIYDTGTDSKYNKPLESLSVNLPLGSTITAKAYKNYEQISEVDIFITIDENNPGESYKDYYWDFQ